MLPDFVPSGCMPMPWCFFFLNDDPGLTLTIFMIGSNSFSDASVWVTAYKALSAHTPGNVERGNQTVMQRKSLR